MKHESRISIVTMGISIKSTHRFGSVPFKLQVTFFTDMEKKSLKGHLEIQKTRMTKGILNKKDKCMQYYSI